MKLSRNLAAALLTGLFALSTMAAMLDLNGVKLQDSIELQGSKLQLNGAGTRYKAVFKVYTAALYLGKKASTAQEVINQPGLKRLSLTMLRGVDSRELGHLFARSIEDNMDKADLSKVIPGLIRMSDIFSAQRPLVAGDTITVDWVPGVGTVVTIKGQVQGEPFKEPEFFRGMMMIWLGPVPADQKLKDALLAGST